MNCQFLEHQVCVRADGQYRLCCVSLEPNNEENIKTHTPEDWLNSTTHKDVVKKFTQGVWPDACRTCANREAQGLPSKRTQANLGPGISHLDIRFGNSCNLKCISCWEQSSSSIAEEAIEMQKQGIIPINNVLEVPNFNWASEAAIEQLVKYPLKEVYLTGGEPMMVKHLPMLLERLDSSVMIRFNTNGTVYNPKLEKLLKRFNVVNMAVSIDAIGKRAEYIRYGSNWHTIETNFNKYKEYCRVSITPTVSVLNELYIDEVHEWADQNSVEVYLNYLENPEYLNINKAQDSEQRKKFVDVITRLDSFRNVSIKDYLPEVAAAYGIS
jgi:MoaA/NifB/PqqE/SkfB family radical SAM enzyme